MHFEFLDLIEKQLSTWNKTLENLIYLCDSHEIFAIALP